LNCKRKEGEEMKVRELIDLLKGYEDNEVVLSFVDKEGYLHLSSPVVDVDDTPVMLHLIGDSK